MRRIGARFAKPEMKLLRPVYDNSGLLLFERLTVLDEAKVGQLQVYGVREVIIDDPRVEDVPVQPLISPELEAEAIRALRDLMVESGPSGPVHDLLVAQLEKPVYAMARELFPDVAGEPNVAGGSTPDDYRYVRPVKVASMAMLIGRKLGWAWMELSALGMAAVLMDVGTLSLDEEALRTFDPYANPAGAHETAHAHDGAELMRSTKIALPQALDGVQHHHERYDGSGLPDGVRGEEIPAMARAIAVADTYFELVQSRPGRKATMPHEAVEYIMASSGELFDPEMVEVFVHQVPLYPTGITVQLNTGEIGIVSDSNLGLIGRPMVRICLDEEGRGVHPYDLDLAEQENQGRLVVQVMGY